MEKRRCRKRILAVVMSFLMVFSMLIGTNTMTASADEGETGININVQKASDTETGGTVYYKVGDALEWTDADTIEPDGFGRKHWVPANTKVSLKVVVAEGYEIATASIGVRGSGVSLTADEQTALVSENGYTYTIPATGEYEFEIRFQSQNSGGGDNPGQPGVENGFLKFTCHDHMIEGGSIYYKLDDADSFTQVSEDDNQYASINVSEASKITIKVDAKSGYQLDTVRGVTLRANGTDKYSATGDDTVAFTNEDGVELDLASWAGEDNVANTAFELEFGFGNADGGGDNPEQPGPGASEDFTVKIGETTVYQANATEGKKITVPDNAPYNVEETNEGIAIKPKEGTDKEHNPEADIEDKVSITLDPIVVTGSGKVEVHAGLNYTPDGVTDGSHIEEDVPIIIKASDTTGYSFEAKDDAELSICWGGFRSTATLLGGVKARGFTVTDLKTLTIGTSDKPVAAAFCAPLRESGGEYIVYESSYVEFNLAETKIYANTAFENYNEIRAWDEAAVSVNATTVFDNVNSMQVQTGGKFDLTSDSAIDLPEKVQSGYYTEIGQILQIPDDGRFQDAVNIVDCQEGDFTNQKGRYKYTVSEEHKHVVLESTTNTLWALGYSFRPDSGDQYVKNGHFEISAGSGLVREDTTDGGEYWFEAGTEVTFKLVPDTGYRYKEGTFTFNGDASERVVEPTENPGVYIFTMQSNPIHVSCEFEKAEDEIDVAKSDAVKAADIDVPDGAINGVAEFGVADKELTPEQEEKFANAAENMVLATALDLSMNEVIDKIGAEESWVTSVTELEKPMAVTLDLESSLGGYENYTVVRQHNDAIEQLDTQYDSKTNSITFETDKYSTYVIAHSKEKTHVHTPIVKNIKEPTCKDTGYTGDTYCEECGEKIATGKTVSKTENHKWDAGKITKAATATEKGVKTYTCTVCGTTKTETIPATGIPKAGTEIKDTKGNASYKVTGSDAKNPTVTYTGTTSSTTKTVTIPATITVDGVTYKVTAIADSALKGNKTITKVTIPKNVTTIGKNAFNGCTKLKSVTIGSSVTTIGANAFKGCTVLTKVTIPSKVTTIGSNAFNGCTKLETVTVGSSVTTIGAGAFKSCKALTKIALPSKTTKIGANAFNGCTKLMTITIKSKNMTSKTISNNAFKGISTKATIKVPSGKAKTYKTLFQKKGLSKKVKVK